MPANDPVIWTADPQHKAVRIRCATCNACQWVDPKRSDRCIYGGPFTGYDDPISRETE